MPAQFKTEEVKSASKVVATVDTPVFGPIVGASPDISDPSVAATVAGFLDAAEWLKANIDSAAKLPGTSEGKIVDGPLYALALITTQNSTNMKNRERSQFNQAPSKQSFMNKAYEEFTSLAPDKMASLASEWKDKGGLPEWAKQRAAALEAEWKAARGTDEGEEATA